MSNPGSHGWQAFGELTLVWLRPFLRRPEGFFWILVFPIISTVALGIAFAGQKEEPLRIAVQNGPDAQAVLARLSRLEGLEPVLLDPDAAQSHLQRGQVSLIVVPAGPVLVTNEALASSANAKWLVNAVLTGDSVPVQVTDVLEAGVGGRPIDFFLPGILGFALMMTSLMVISMGVIEMREGGLMKCLCATPMSRGQFVLGIVVARLCSAIPQVIVLVLLGVALFGVAVHGSWFDLVLWGMLGAAAFGSIALLISSRAQGVHVVLGRINLILFTMLFFAGVFFPVSQFPALMQPVLRVLPLTALNDGFRAIMDDGRRLVDLQFELFVLVGWSLLGFALAIRRFRWN